ncbi:long chain base biosynthesis protein 2a [Tanacetum coccineum]
MDNQEHTYGGHKIIVVVEGIYSMEGEICKLPEIVSICKKYKVTRIFTKGSQKLAKVRENSNYFRSELQKMGFDVLGDYDSPVMPIMIYNPAKIAAFSRECLKAGAEPENLSRGATL